MHAPIVEYKVIVLQHDLYFSLRFLEIIKIKLLNILTINLAQIKH